MLLSVMDNAKPSLYKHWYKLSATNGNYQEFSLGMLELITILDKRFILALHVTSLLKIWEWTSSSIMAWLLSYECHIFKLDKFEIKWNKNCQNMQMCPLDWSDQEVSCRLLRHHSIAAYIYYVADIGRGTSRIWMWQPPLVHLWVVHKAVVI